MSISFVPKFYTMAEEITLKSISELTFIQCIKVAQNIAACHFLISGKDYIRQKLANILRRAGKSN